MDALVNKLSPAQNLLRRTAARRPHGRVIPPDILRCGARAKVLTALLQHGWQPHTVRGANSGMLRKKLGYGVVFNKELFHLLKQELGFSQAGIYIREADPVRDRLGYRPAAHTHEQPRKKRARKSLLVTLLVTFQPSSKDPH